MEAVGARLGRSSTRYGPTTVFSGPVRRWKKKWVHVAPPSSSSNVSSSSRDRDGVQSSQSANGSNSNNGSHVMLYKWTPISQRDNSGTIGDATPDKDDGAEEPPRKKLKYIPIALLEEQNEATEQAEEDSKATEADLSTDERASKSNTADEKPDMNDTPMKETEDADGEQEERQDLNKSTLDLSLGLTSHDEGNSYRSKTDGD
uniref:Uncharacterized protein n=1 Tax=Kalanchoe fedtschenkoi TaxID=63787 RepID=A0A7N1A2M1_KALFE